jgi:DHA1 family tetracycline resistance protein-like MFS transporter
MALSSSLAWYVIGMVIYGFTAFVAGPLSSYVTTARRNMSVGAALTFTSAAFNAGAIIGPYLGGVIGQNSGLKQTFYFSSLTFLVSTIILFFIRPQPVENTDHHSPITALKSVANPHFLKFLTLAFITFLFMYLPQPLSQNFLRSERGYGLIDIGILLSLRSLGIVVFNLGIGRLPLGLGIMLSHAGMALATFLLWQVSGAAAYKTAYFLFGIYQTKRILTNANARELVETKNMGIAYGLVETVGAVVIIVGPPLAGFLYSINPTLPFSLSFFMILSFLMFDLFFRRKAKSGISMDKIPD